MLDDKPPPEPSVKRFLLSTSDVLDGGQKLYLADEKTGETKWYKTRTLTHDEIIDEIRTPEPSDALHYTIHRPIRGWYIHVRNTAQSNGVIALTPNPLVNPDKPDSDCELMMHIPTKFKGKERDQNGPGGLKDQDEWSFPPTIRSPPRRSPRGTNSASTSQTTSPIVSKFIHTDPLRSPAPPSSTVPNLAPVIPTPQTVPLVFAPLPPPVLPTSQPVLSRAYASGFLRVLANTLFSPPRRSFVLSVQIAGTSSLEAVPTPIMESGPADRGPLVPVLTYTDTTPVLAISKMTGMMVVDLSVLEVQGAEGEQQVGLVVSAALAYLDFLKDREGYIAAANGG